MAGKLNSEIVALQDAMSKAPKEKPVPYPDWKTGPPDSEAPKQLKANCLTNMWKRTEQVASVKAASIEGPNGPIPLRIYHPDPSKKDLPVLVYFHGGCWFLNSLDTHDPLMGHLANQGHMVVIGVDYRLAPEHPFPAGLEDCYAATAWAAKNGSSYGGDGRKLAVSGDSCGGNLSIAVSLLVKERGGPRLALQVPLVPMTDSPYPGTPSLNDYYATGFGYTKEVHMLGWECYGAWNKPHSKEHPSPLAAVLQADLSGLTKAHVITAQCDIVHDEGVKVAKAMKAAGTPCTFTDYPGVPHGFISLACVAPQYGLRVTEGEKALAEMCAKLQAAFESVGSEQ